MQRSLRLLITTLLASKDHLQVWTSKIDSVSLADVEREAAAYLDPAPWSLIEVGPASGEKKPQ
jgi:predicted Zn-dependent peptidase